MEHSGFHNLFRFWNV